MADKAQAPASSRRPDRTVAPAGEGDSFAPVAAGSQLLRQMAGAGGTGALAAVHAGAGNQAVQRLAAPVGATPAPPSTTPRTADTRSAGERFAAFEAALAADAPDAVPGATNAAPPIQREIDKAAFLASSDIMGRPDAVRVAYTWYLSVKDDWDPIEKNGGDERQIATLERNIAGWQGNLTVLRLLSKARQEPFKTGIDEMAREVEAMRTGAARQAGQITTFSHGLAGVDDLTLPTVEAINPKSLVPYKILHDTFHQSWEYAKEQLATPPRGTNVRVRQALMRKLWEYRDWHSNLIIRATADRLRYTTGDAGALDPARTKAAGSRTLTSDIDVNLKGNQTEAAVAVFNDLFKQNDELPAHRWDFEPGIVYDVNVYAMDWMHLFGGIQQPGSTVEQASAAPRTPLAPSASPSTDTRVQGLETVTANVSVAEGARSDRRQGGISDAAVAAGDAVNSDVFSLVKVRLYMTPPEWEDYKASRRLRAGREAIFTRAEEEYAKYRAAIVGEMRRETGQVVSAPIAAPADGATGAQELQGQAGTLLTARGGVSADPHAAAAQRGNLLMASSNRIYEQKVMVIAAERAVLKRMVDTYDTQFEVMNETTRAARNREIDVKLARIRSLVLEANLYANEASITHGGVQHGVVGLQGGRALHLAKDDLLDAVNEHMGDALKEIGRHRDVAEAIYKAAKYLWRMGDAAKDAGFGALPEVERLYRVCYQIAEHVKGTVDNPEETSMMLFLQDFDAPDIAALRQVVTRIGTRIQNAAALARTRGAELGQATPGRDAASGKGLRNENM